MTTYADAKAALAALLYTGGPGHITPELLNAGVAGIGDALKDGRISLKADFRATGDGSTSDASAWSSLIAAYPSVGIACVAVPGTYTCPPPQTVPANIRVQFVPGANMVSGHSLTMKRFDAPYGGTIMADNSFGQPSSQTSFEFLQLDGVSDHPTSGREQAAWRRVFYGNQDGSLNPATGVYNTRFETFKLASGRGGHVGLAGYSQLVAGNGGDTGPNNIGVLAQAAAGTSANYGGTLGSPKGAVYGLNALGTLASGATHFNNLTACEMNVAAAAGSSVNYKTILQLASLATDAVHADTREGMLSFAGGGGIGWNAAIIFGDAHGGGHPVATSGTLIQTYNSSTVANGIDFSSYTITGYLLQGTGRIGFGGTEGDTSAVARFTPFGVSASYFYQDTSRTWTFLDASNGIIATLADNATLTLGIAGAGALGILALTGTTSGVVSIKPQPAAGTWNCNLPITAGSAGQALTSQGGGSTAMTWVSYQALSSELTAIAALSSNGFAERTGSATWQITGFTGTGNVARATAPTFVTSITTPIAIGGTGVGSALILRSTSGVGTSDAIIAQVGNAGGTEAWRVDTAGQFHLGRTGQSGSNPGTSLMLGFSNNFNESVTTDGGSTALWYMNRQSADGSIFEFRRAGAAKGTITINGSNTLWNSGGVQVVGARVTGWGAPSGTLQRTALSDASTATDVLRTLQALVTDMRSHGLIGN